MFGERRRRDVERLGDVGRVGVSRPFEVPHPEGRPEHFTLAVREPVAVDERSVGDAVAVRGAVNEVSDLDTVGPVFEPGDHVAEPFEVGEVQREIEGPLLGASVDDRTAQLPDHFARTRVVVRADEPIHALVAEVDHCLCVDIDVGSLDRGPVANPELLDVIAVAARPVDAGDRPVVPGRHGGGGAVLESAEHQPGPYAVQRVRLRLGSGRFVRSALRRLRGPRLVSRRLAPRNAVSSHH